MSTVPGGSPLLGCRARRHPSWQADLHPEPAAGHGLGHRHRGGGGDDRPSSSPSNEGAWATWRRSPRPREPAARPRDRDETGSEQPSGERLGDARRKRTLGSSSPTTLLHRLVDGEQRARPAAQLPPPRRRGRGGGASSGAFTVRRSLIPRCRWRGKRSSAHPARPRRVRRYAGATSSASCDSPSPQVRKVRRTMTDWIAGTLAAGRAARHVDHLAASRAAPRARRRSTWPAQGPTGQIRPGAVPTTAGSSWRLRARRPGVRCWPLIVRPRAANSARASPTPRRRASGPPSPRRSPRG